MRLYSNEIVFRGHPDKVCDQISAAILQECIRKDPGTRAGIEVAGGKGRIFVTGELTTKADHDIQGTVRNVLQDVGYRDDYEIIDNVGRQSEDIAIGVDTGGAGDQGMMFGFACSQTKEMLPTAMVVLQRLAEEYDDLRKRDGRFLPDGKAQITGIYDDDWNLKGIKEFLVSYQNTEEDRHGTDGIIRDMVRSIVPNGIEILNIMINPTGRFRIGGFDGDAGLTGRKLAVDAYHSFAKIGGGCMNGKDPSKVDFSAAHKAREIAKAYVKGGCRWCEIQLSYAIGKEMPLAIYIDTDRGPFMAPASLYRECSPRRMTKDLDLVNADFVELAKFGHFRS